MTQEIQSKGPRFTFDEYRDILRLMCDVSQKDNDMMADDTRSSVSEELMLSNTPKSRYNYNEWLMKLLDVMDNDEN